MLNPKVNYSTMLWIDIKINKFENVILNVQVTYNK